MWWIISALASPTCDATALEVSIQALDGAKDASVAPLMATDLVDACTFDPALVSALERASAHGDDAETLVGALSDRWSLICPTLTEAGPADALFEGCEIGRWGLATESGWNRRQGFPYLAVFAADAMRQADVDRDRIQIVFRRLAGIPRTGPDGVIREFSPLF